MKIKDKTLMEKPTHEATIKGRFTMNATEGGRP